MDATYRFAGCSSVDVLPVVHLSVAGVEQGDRPRASKCADVKASKQRLTP